MSTYNFTINQGDDWSIKLVIKDSNGLAIDLTGYTFQGQMREKYDASTIIASFTATLANQITNPGEVTLSLTNVQTSAIPTLPATAKDKRPLTEYIYDVEQTDVSLKKTRILEGFIKVSPEVTR